MITNLSNSNVLMNRMIDMCQKSAIKELLKHIVGGFLFHGFVIFAASGLIGVASFLLPFSVEILNTYKDLFILSGVSGFFAGILGATRAIQSSNYSDKKMGMVPQFIKDILNKQYGFQSNGTSYVLSKTMELRIYKAQNWRQYFLI